MIRQVARLFKMTFEFPRDVLIFVDRAVPELVSVSFTDDDKSVTVTLTADAVEELLGFLRRGDGLTLTELADEHRRLSERMIVAAAKGRG